MEKLYKYVGITVVSLVVVIIIINLFHLNTKVIESFTADDMKKGLSVKEVKEQKEQEEIEMEKQQGTPLEKTLLKISKTNDNMDNLIKPYTDDKEVTEDILLELDEICDKAILYFTIMVGGDGKLDLSDKKSFDKPFFEHIERLMSFKKAINRSMKFVTNSGGSTQSGNTGGMFG